MSLTRIIPFKAEHVSQIKTQPHDDVELIGVNYKVLESMKWQYSIEIDGVVKACCGLNEYWPGRAECWTIIDKNIGDKFFRLIRAMKEFLNNVDCQRVEAAVIFDFPEGHRLAKLLGFDLEAKLMRKYGVTGLNYSLYSRVK